MKFGDFRRIRHLEWPWLPEADTPIQHFKDVDFFIPYTVGYANTSLSTLAAVRKAGQKAGWYTSGVPSGHGSLNCKQHTRRFETHDLHSRQCELVCCLCASYVALASVREVCAQQGTWSIPRCGAGC